MLPNNRLSPGHESEVCTAMLQQRCVENRVFLWSMTYHCTAYWGCFRTYSVLPLSSAVWWCFTSAVVGLVQRSLVLNCPVGKHIHFPTLPAHVCRVWVNHSTWLYRGTWCILVLGHIRCISVLPKLLCCWRQQHVFRAWQVTQQHYVQQRGCIVSSCDFLSPQLMCLHYSIWLLYCRSAIVLMHWRHTQLHCLRC